VLLISTTNTVIFKLATTTITDQYLDEVDTLDDVDTDLALWQLH